MNIKEFHKAVTVTTTKNDEIEPETTNFFLDDEMIINALLIKDHVPLSEYGIDYDQLYHRCNKSLNVNKICIDNEVEKETNIKVFDNVLDSTKRDEDSKLIMPIT